MDLNKYHYLYWTTVDTELRYKRRWLCGNCDAVLRTESKPCLFINLGYPVSPVQCSSEYKDKLLALAVETVFNGS